MSQEKWGEMMGSLHSDIAATQGVPKVLVCDNDSDHDSVRSSAVRVALMAQGIRVLGIAETMRHRFDNLRRYEIAAIRALESMSALISTVPYPYNSTPSPAKRNWRKARRRAQIRWAKRRGSRALRTRA